MKTTKVGRIIHIFALLHAVVAFLCIHAGAADELLLTTLTMAMTLLVCIRSGSDIEFTAACIIVANILGYLIGITGAEIFDRLVDSKSLSHALATAATTELLGWGIVALTKFVKKNRPSSTGAQSISLKWIVASVAGVFLIRVGIIFLTHSQLYDSESMLDTTLHMLSNSFALITLICLNIIQIRQVSRVKKTTRPIQRATVMVAFMLAAAFVAAAICSVDISLNLTITSWKEFTEIYIIALITQITTYCLVYMCNFAVTTGNKVRREKEQKHAAQYQYQKLKRQVNPHFLFNSLNVLDCMVWEDKPEKSSTYIHKLANVYRYMIRSEEEEVVTLGEELVFVGLYIDLLHVRFPKGFEVEICVSDEDKARYVLPCSIQLLIENATKHNTVSEERPLTIRVESDGSQVRVSNNIIPKVTKVVSTGLGQKYIRQQYMDLSGKEIHIENNRKEYSVTLPLL